MLAREGLHRRLAMGVGEENPARGQTVNVGRLRLRMPAHAANPVIEIIDRD